MATERDELDAKKRLLRRALDQHPVIVFDDPRALGRYAAAIEELANEGFAEREAVDVGVEVRRKL